MYEQHIHILPVLLLSQQKISYQQIIPNLNQTIQTYICLCVVCTDTLSKQRRYFRIWIHNIFSRQFQHHLYRPIFGFLLAESRQTHCYNMASAETSVSTIEYRAAQQYVDNLTQTGRQTKANVDSSKPMSLPAWFDETRFRKAQLLFRRDGYSTLACTMVGMLSIMAVPSVVSVLVYTKQSATPQLAYRRYLSTVQHVASWIIDELKPGTRSWKSLEMVRKRHVLSSRSSEAAANGIISQADMALFQFALIGYVLYSLYTINREMSLRSSF